MKLSERGVYTLGGMELVAVVVPDDVTFLFTPHNWGLRGAVAYRLSHGRTFQRGDHTERTDEDLVDTGRTAGPPKMR